MEWLVFRQSPKKRRIEVTPVTAGLGSRYRFPS